MKKYSSTFLTIFLISYSLISYAQVINVLHYTETSGYDHGTRSVSQAMFESFENVSVTSDATGDEFSDLNHLLTYDIIVFSNTSGDQILNQEQRDNFESFIDAGGHFMGIHAASDTYRHSSANGGSTGTWDFYAETLGGSVQTNPNHVSGTPFYEMFHIEDHASLFDLPDPWGKNEEYYYWENGYLDNNNTVILEVESTVGPNGQVNSYDAQRPVSWYKKLATGSRVFYTSMGHAQSNFVADTLFQKHIEQALHWCVQTLTADGLELDSPLPFEIFPNPVLHTFQLNLSQFPAEMKILTKDGKVVRMQILTSASNIINVSFLSSGVYYILIENQENLSFKKMIKIN